MKTKKGFTLVETLLGVLVVGIILGIGAFSLMSFQNEADKALFSNYSSTPTNLIFSLEKKVSSFRIKHSTVTLKVGESIINYQIVGNVLQKRITNQNQVENDSLDMGSENIISSIKGVKLLKNGDLKDFGGGTFTSTLGEAIISYNINNGKIISDNLGNTYSYIEVTFKNTRTEEIFTYFL